MSDPKATRTVTVTNPEGVHFRAATLIVEVVRQFDTEVVLRKGDESATVSRQEKTEFFNVLALCAQQGDRLLLEATGSESQQALDALEQLFVENFRENEENTEANKQP